MGESHAHSILVRHLVDWVATQYLAGHKEGIQVDSLTSAIKPNPVGGYVPDLYVSPNMGRLIIGEAKTVRDFETKHSQDQITTFLRKCSETDGAVFVLAIPWTRARFARSMLKRICNQNGILNVKMDVLDQLPE